MGSGDTPSQRTSSDGLDEKAIKGRGVGMFNELVHVRVITAEERHRPDPLRSVHLTTIRGPCHPSCGSRGSDPFGRVDPGGSGWRGPSGLGLC